MTTPDERLQEAAAALRRTQRPKPAFARVRQRIRRRRAISAAAAAAVVVAVLLPLTVFRSGHDRVEITNRGATTVPATSVPPVRVPLTVPPVTSRTTAPRATSTSASTSTTRPNVVTAAIRPQRIALVAPGRLWILGDNPLTVSRTTDGGVHWIDVTPMRTQASADGIVYGFSARDDRNAVLAISTGANTVTLLRTTDGGATWTTAITGAYESEYFSFVSARHGWVEASRGAAMGSEPVDILRTRDGGAHWDVMSRSQSNDAQDPGTKGALSTGCDKTGIGFVDDSTGFATGICAAPGYYFYVTHDAGRTWKAQDLPRPPGITQADVDAGAWVAELVPPVFDGANGAGTTVRNLATSSSTATHHAFVYFTRDRGAHWSIADPPLPNATWARAVDANNWWAGNATTLVHTSDAGAHWDSMPNTGLDLQIDGTGDLQFATPTNGWALTNNSSTGDVRLLGTDDGGRTWRPVPLPKIP
jgi:photosystem II stability/assembly factor-like uncharacterized protein